MPEPETEPQRPETLSPAAAAAADRKAEAEARKAEAEARKLEHELAELERQAADDLTRRTEEAEARKEIAAAEDAAAKSRSDALGRLLPDLAEVERGSLTTAEGTAFYGAALTARATESAAQAVARAVKRAAGDNYRVLVTTDTALAASDAVLQQVSSEITALIEAATAVLAQHAATVAPRAPGAPGLEVVEREDRARAATGGGVAGAVAGAAGMLALGPVGDAVAAVAAAVPAALSLFSAQRTLAHAETTTADAVAATAVAGALSTADAGGMVLHDDQRLFPTGGVFTRLGELRAARARLRPVLVAAQVRKAEAEVTLAAARDRLKARGAARRPEELAAAAEERDRAILELARLAAQAEQVRLTIEGIDTLIAGVTTVPPGGARSLLMTAALREVLRENRVGHVVVVQGAAGSVHQSLEDRPLFFEDRFSVVATASITYLVLALRSGQVAAGGTATGAATLAGRIGAEVRISDIDGAAAVRLTTA